MFDLVFQAKFSDKYDEYSKKWGGGITKGFNIIMEKLNTNCAHLKQSIIGTKGVNLAKNRGRLTIVGLSLLLRSGGTTPPDFMGSSSIDHLETFKKQN
ncbi:hypothetical protein LXL04_034330 [Taraxacum kok-saghyz]